MALWIVDLQGRELFAQKLQPDGVGTLLATLACEYLSTSQLLNPAFRSLDLLVGGRAAVIGLSGALTSELSPGSAIATHEEGVHDRLRERPSDVVYDYRGISGQHARLDFDGKRFLLTDLKSTNGTFVRRGEKLLRLEPNVPLPIDEGEKAILSALELRVYLGTRHGDAELGALIQEHNKLVAQEHRKKVVAKPKRAERVSGWGVILVGAASVLLLAAAAWMALR